MRNTKKIITGILVATTICTTPMSVFASVESPTYVNVENLSKQDCNTKDHKDCTVVSEFNDTGATVFRIMGDKDKEDITVDLKFAKDPETDEEIPITEIGKEDGVFKSKDGHKITDVIFSTDANSLTVNSNAFKNSNVKCITINCNNVMFAKDAFKNTRNKDIELHFVNANQISAEEDYFNGLENITLVCENEAEKENAKESIAKYFTGNIN